MARYVALVRGLGGAFGHIIPMKELAALLGKQGLREVRTYIASGNAVFSAGKIDPVAVAGRVTKAIERRRRFAPWVVILTRAQLARAIAANPFAQAEGAPASLHLVFLAQKPRAVDFAPLDRLLKPNERYALKGKVFYFFAPDGVGKSRAFPRVERTVGLGTARNWRTCRTLLEMADERG